MVAENEPWIQVLGGRAAVPHLRVEVPVAAGEVHQPINAAILNRLDELRHDLPPLARGEAWQSGHGLHKQEDLRELVSRIDAAVDAALTFLRVDYRQVLTTGCWADVNAPGAAHRMHAHPNNVLSGVYYVQVQGGADTINFHDPRAQAAIMRPTVTELTAYNTDQVVVSVNPGTLIVFRLVAALSGCQPERAAAN